MKNSVDPVILSPNCSSSAVSAVKPAVGAIRKYKIGVMALVTAEIVITVPAGSPDPEKWTSAPVISSDVVEAIMDDNWDIQGPADGSDLYKVENAEPLRQCRVCGCTENEPCYTSEGPCGWAGEDLCTACFDDWVEEEYFAEGAEGAEEGKDG